MTATVSPISRQDEVSDQLSLLQAVGLHLAPGIFITLAYSAAGLLFAQWGLPQPLVLLATMLFVALPLEFGYLLYQGWKRNGRLSLEGVIRFREPISRRLLATLGLGLLVWAAVASTLMAPVDESVRRSLFAWWPAVLDPSNFVRQMDLYSPSALWAVALGSLVLNVVVPTVEELYFRGYLLPRMDRWGWLAPLSSLLLFSLYHFWLPWQNPSRLVALLPAILVVYRCRSVKLSILVHVALNSLGSLALLAMVIGR